MNYTGKGNRIRFLEWLPAALAVLAFAGCAVGPDYVPADVSMPEAWHTELREYWNGGQSDPQTLASWWTRLNDPILSSLVERAVAGNLDLKEARSRVREARARRGGSRGGLFPTIDASGSLTRRRGSESTGSGNETDLYSTGLDAGWELDLFGGVRRSVEAADADLQASSEGLRNVLVSLLAEVALNYVEVRTYQARLAVAEANLDAQQETYRLNWSRYQAGLIDDLAVQQARYNLENTRSQIPTFRTGLEGAKNRLAVLLGERPGAVHAELEKPSPIPVAPVQIAVGVPADILRRRPDVRQAERDLAAQTARVGVATADLYPKFSLLGSIGLEALSLDNLFLAGSRTYRFGPHISWPIFDAGTIRSNIEAQSALQEQALIRYEFAILTALEEVENALVVYAEEQCRRESLSEATQAATQAAELAMNQYQAGLIGFNDVLDAQRSLFSFQEKLAESDGAVTSNLVRLYKALGGGWVCLTPDTTK
ncbi:MAG: efflux transporter outer membrane subunit [Pseudomonadota bacterium]